MHLISNRPFSETELNKTAEHEDTNPNYGKYFVQKIRVVFMVVLFIVLVLKIVQNLWFMWKILKRVMIRARDYFLFIMSLSNFLYCLVIGLIATNLISHCGFLRFFKVSSESIMHLSMFAVIYEQLNRMNKSCASRLLIWFLIVWIFFILLLNPMTYTSEASSTISAEESPEKYEESDEIKCVGVSPFQSKALAITYEIVRCFFLQFSLGLAVLLELYTLRTTTRRAWDARRPSEQKLWFIIIESVVITTLWNIYGIIVVIQTVKSHPFITSSNLNPNNSAYDMLQFIYCLANPVILFYSFYPRNARWIPRTRARPTPSEFPNRCNVEIDQPILDLPIPVRDCIIPEIIVTPPDYEVYMMPQCNRSQQLLIIPRTPIPPRKKLRIRLVHDDDKSEQSQGV